MAVFVGVGMLVKAKCGPETIWWTAKISSIFALLFLFLAVVIGLVKYTVVVFVALSCFSFVWF